MTLLAGSTTPIDDEMKHDPLASVAVIEAEIRRRSGAGIGRLDEMCGYALVPGGKLFRPVLLIESAVAVGGQVEAVLAAAVGTECGHVESLIHDDIIDREDMGRGRPSVPAAFGADDAIVTGDRLLSELSQNLAECRAAGVPSERFVAALIAVAAAGIGLCRGQTLEAETTGTSAAPSSSTSRWSASRPPPCSAAPASRARCSAVVTPSRQGRRRGVRLHPRERPAHRRCPA